MLRFVWVDPCVARDASSRGQSGWGALIALFRSIEQNCILADVSGLPSLDETGFKELMKDSATAHQRHVLSELLKNAMAKSVRVTPQQGPCVDAAINSESNSGLCRAPHTFRWSEFAESSFEEERSRDAVEGILSDSFHSADDLLDACFYRAVKYAHSLDLYDAVLGEVKPNFEIGLTKLLTWLHKVADAPGTMRITFHTQAPFEKDEYGDFVHDDQFRRVIDLEGMQQAREKLANILEKTGWARQGKLVFYRRMVHDRFLMTNQIAFEIGRGFDFVDNKGKLRDVTVHLRNRSRLKLFFRMWNKESQVPLQL